MATLRTLPKGIGTKAEVDQANAFMRDQPWYQADLARFGQDPNNVHLSDAQAKELFNDERAHGIGLSNHWKIDESGNIHDASMGIGKKIAIGAALAGAVASGFGAAGMGPLAGLFGSAGAAGAGGAGASGLLGSTTIGTGLATLPGAAATSGLLGAGAAGAAGAGAAGGLLGSATLGSGMASLPGAAGTSGLLGGAGGAAGGSGVGIGSTIKNFLMGGDGHKGLDPTSLLLGGLSLFQGDGQPDPYKGSTTNPEATLSDALGRTHGLLDQLQKRGPAHLRMPAPISIQGLPFQIGGGLGTDPSGQGGSFKIPSAYDEDPSIKGGNPFSTAQFGSSPLLKGWADRLTHGK